MSRFFDAKLERLRKWVAGRGPSSCTFDFTLWTRQMVRGLSKREFETDYASETPGEYPAQRGTATAEVTEPFSSWSWRVGHGLIA
jgi:hypothetical protein